MYHSAVGEVRGEVGTDADSIPATKVTTFVSSVAAGAGDVSKPPSTAEVLLTRVMMDLKTEWTDFVHLVASTTDSGNLVPEALAEFISKHTNVGIDSVQRKLDAIFYHLKNLSYSADDIIALGQEKTLSAYGKSKRAEKYGEQVQLRFTIPGSQREIVMQEVERIKHLLGMKDSEGYWDFILSLTRSLNDDELRHLAGSKVPYRERV